MKKVLFPLFILTSLALVGCTENNGGSSSNQGGESGNTSSSTPIDDGKITVYFYLDYNQVTIENVYHSYRIENNSLLQEPPTPETKDAPLPQFSVFKGWSVKQIIDNEDDLWDFSSDIMSLGQYINAFRLYGQWAAQGE